MIPANVNVHGKELPEMDNIVFLVTSLPTILIIVHIQPISLQRKKELSNQYLNININFPNISNLINKHNNF
jgi:hypothetical protein